MENEQLSYELKEYNENDILNRLENSVCKIIKKLLYSKSPSNIYTLVCLISIMNILHRNINEGYHSTLRDIFYNNPGLYRKQSNSNKSIALITHLTKTPRELLNVVSTAKGRIRGPLIINSFEYGSGGRNNRKKVKLDCMSIFENMGHSISPYIFKNMKSLNFNIYNEVRFVLIVEKDTIFQRLLECNFMEKFNNSCILITAKGFSDMPTRTLLYRLSMELSEKTKFWILCDYDCYGLSIAITYVLGGKLDTWYDSSFSITKINPFKIPSVSKLKKEGLLLEDNILNMCEDEITRIVRIKNRLISSNDISENIKLKWIDVCEQMINDQKKFEIDCILDIEEWLFKNIENDLKINI